MPLASRLANRHLRAILGTMNHTHDHTHHHHGHGHSHAHTHAGRLGWAAAANMLLTAAQIIGGVAAGSLALVADGLHNLSDAAALVVALVAGKVGLRPADAAHTYGYQRAEMIGALINTISLFMVGLYLALEAVRRLVDPQPIEGMWVMVLAGIALPVNGLTTLLTWKGSSENLNLRAVFIHNLSDVLASVAVLAGGFAMWRYQAYWVDAALTIVIAAYTLIHAWHLVPGLLRILMQGAPAALDTQALTASMAAVEGVKNVHHLHVWQLNESQTLLEAHIAVSDMPLSRIEACKARLKEVLSTRYNIIHSTLEFELATTDCAEADCSVDHHEEHDHTH